MAELTAAAASEVWRELTRTAPARLFAVGDFEPEKLLEWAEEALANPGSGDSSQRVEEPPSPVATRTVIETDEVSQSKLLIGCHVDLSDLDRAQFDALRVAGSLLGGGFHSRLFRTIREQHSLAYAASASLDRVAGECCVLAFGIDAKNREQVLDLCAAELRSLQTTPPGREEMQQTLQTLKNGLRSMLDSPNSMAEALEGSLASGFPRSVESIARDVLRVTAEDVVQAARRIAPPAVVYCLQERARDAD